jgi:hypothetical protein
MHCYICTVLFALLYLHWYIIILAQTISLHVNSNTIKVEFDQKYTN